jgi:hypothetical protein
VSDDALRADVLERLRLAIASDRLSGPVRTQAAEMLERLRNGVRLVVTGPKGSGKTEICSLLFQSFIRPAPATAVAVRFSGKQCSTPEECETTAEGDVLTRLLPAAFLSEVQVADVAGSADTREQTRRMRWALGRADMVLWCCTDFTPEDAALWADVPDSLKDHSFLVLTKADRLAESGALAERIREMQVVAQDEFHSLFPTSARAGAEMLRQEGVVTEACLLASGIKALSEAILRLAASGRRADLDGAQLFLQRHGLEDLLPEPQADDALSVRHPIKPVHPLLEVFEAALAGLSDPSCAQGDVDAGALLAWCGDFCDGLCAKVAEVGHDADYSLLLDQLCDASDRMVLLSLENDLRSAADAASILLQLRRDIECFSFS